MILPLKMRPVYTLKKLPPCLNPSLTLDHKHFICLLNALNLSWFSCVYYIGIKIMELFTGQTSCPFIIFLLCSCLTYRGVKHSPSKFLMTLGKKPQNSFYQSNSCKKGNCRVSSLFIVYI